MKKTLVGTLLAVCLFFTSFFPVSAAENFTTTLHTTYTVNNQGQTQVKQLITLVNKTPTLYAKQYGLKISIPDLKNVTVSSNGQKLIPEVVNTTDQTSIGITFPDELVGEGKERNIEISYASPTSAVVSGQVLEVLVPTLGGAEEYDNYQVTLNTPAKFGLPTRTSPVAHQAQSDGSQVVTTFTPSQGSSVTALFGQQQVFEIRLRYNLDNTSTNPGIAQIALPPDTPYQKLAYQVLEPRPHSMAADIDGNWIATYQLEPQSQVVVYAVAKVFISLDPAANFSTPTVRNTLKSGQEFWETNADPISDQADKLDSIKAVYAFVVKTLNYSYENVGKDHPRLGAVQALANPTQALCQEFADLFIALARAKNIPARRLTGYAYTQNPTLRPLSVDQDILHAWAEYFDETSNQWKPVDPTWENTTGGVNYFDQFDLNHIVFAINGESSFLPYPAGSYKLANQNDKDVEVLFAPDFPEEKPRFEVALHPHKIAEITIPGRQQLELTNQTGRAWYHVSLEPKSNDATVSLGYSGTEIPVILPYQTITIPLGMYSSELSINRQTPLQLSLSYQPDNRNQNNQVHDSNRATIQLASLDARVGPFYLQTLTGPAGIIGLGVGSLLLTGLAGSVLVFRQRRSRPVRRKS